VSPELRARMGAAAVAIAREAKYHNAGTVEFLLDRTGDFYFIEVNARIQVEHTVTEMVTGIDLIHQQLRLAAGEPLEITQEDVVMKGHCIECRINAEDPDKDFQPAPGKVDLFVPPGGPGIRVDSHVYSGYRIPPHYDSMIAKLLSWRPTRAEAIGTMMRALDEFVIQGTPTTISILRRILNHSDFRAGEHDTGFVGRHYSGHPVISMKE
jgi:acetyl-CoA carboxylase biotin carboxylase subunit